MLSDPVDRAVMFTGRPVNLLDPRPDEIDVRDIAGSLSRHRRLAGRGRPFYSIAEHSIRVAAHLPRPLRLAGLLHDAPSAWLEVIPEELPDDRALREAPFRIAIAQRFGLPVALPASVTFVGRVLYATALRDIAVPAQRGEARESPLGGVIPLSDRISPLTAHEAEVISCVCSTDMLRSPQRGAL